MSNYIEGFASGFEQAHARGLKEGEARGAESLRKERGRRERLGVRYRAAVGNVRRLEAELDRTRVELRAMCRNLNMFQYDSMVDVLVDARVALTGRPREEIREEHTIHLDAGASAGLLGMMAKSTIDETGRTYADRMRAQAEASRRKHSE